VAGVVNLSRVTLGGRFRLAYFGLAAVFGAAVGAFVVLERSPAPKPRPPWSTWRPTAASPRGQVRQIAAHVGSQYHLTRGKKLVDIYVGSPLDPSTTITAVAVAKTARPEKNSDFSLFDPASTAMYTLCGDPKLKCAIREGKPSEARGALVEREAFELALYTLRYVDGARSVVAFFPPERGKKLVHALFFASDDVAQELNQPLNRTLRDAPPLPSELTVRDRRLISGLTATRLFEFTVQSARNGSLLILVPTHP
jgi:hypothetical protein